MLLVDKTYLSLTQPVFAELRELIEEAGDARRDGRPACGSTASRTSLWADFEDLADVAGAGGRVAPRPSPALEDGRVDELPPPDGLALPLRPYQLAGFRWLAFLWANRLGGVLADDMGLGKTAQCARPHRWQRRRRSRRRRQPTALAVPRRRADLGRSRTGR